MSQFLKIHDSKLESDNYIFQLSLSQYYDLMKDSLFNNEYQRRKVSNANTVYSLLKTDLKSGCVMPPIVLATDETIDESKDIVGQLFNLPVKPIILDGLQRSITISELFKEDKEYADNFANNQIRVELYTKLPKIWLLYRMLTLNTGQTRMSTRHQIEIIYSSYKKKCSIPGVRLIDEVDDDIPVKVGEYSFKDMVDGFTSYLQNDYLTLDRLDVLTNVKELKSLTLKPHSYDVFNKFVSIFHSFVRVMSENAPVELEEQIENLDLKKTPFGYSPVKIFRKSQVLTGFGSAIATLIEKGIINDLEDVENYINEIDITSIGDGTLTILLNLDDVRKYAKKIGNDQRLYFHYFFRNLFDSENTERRIDSSARYAYGQYERNVL